MTFKHGEVRREIDRLIGIRRHKELALDVEADLSTLLLGTKWRHYKRSEHIYVIIGFSWNGDADEWAIHYARAGTGIAFSRTVSNAFATIRGDGLSPVNRFEQV